MYQNSENNAQCTTKFFVPLGAPRISIASYIGSTTSNVTTIQKAVYTQKTCFPKKKVKTYLKNSI